MTEEGAELNRWASLMNARGIANGSARETEVEKLIVEGATMREFANTLMEIKQVSINSITHQNPPLPDFSCDIAGNQLHIELTELIDEDLIRLAKHIQSDPDNPLHGKSLWFDTSYEWFSKLLYATINKKEPRYADRDVKIDVLLIWNDAQQITIENADKWLKNIEVQTLANISSIYFQSWYHPGYLGQPVWSLINHPEIGLVNPVRKPFGP